MPETPHATHLRILKQVVMVSSVCLATVNMGLIVVWPNVALDHLRRDNSTLYSNSITLSDTEMDMVGSVMPAGSILGTLASGKLLVWLGRRRSMMWLTAPCVIGWVIIALSFSPAMILAGRFVVGVYCGLAGIAGPTYVVELPDTAVRGALAALPTLFLQLGYIIVLLSGWSLRWYQIPFIGIGMSMTCFVAMWFIPESPSYLTATGRENEARAVLRSLRGIHADIEDEMNDLRAKNKDVHRISFLKILKMLNIRKSFAILLVLHFLNNFSGLTVFIVNMTRILHDYGPNLNEITSTIMVLTTLLAGGILSLFFLDRIGRRNCMVISLGILAVCLATFGLYVHIKDSEVAAKAEEIKATVPEPLTSTKEVEDTFGTQSIVNIHERYTSEFEVNSGSVSKYKWVPVVCLLVFMVGASIGVTQVPFILTGEYFPASVRAQAGSMCILANSFFHVLALQLFNPMQDALTPAGYYWFTSTICIFGIIFSFVFIVETKGTVIG